MLKANYSVEKNSSNVSQINPLSYNINTINAITKPEVCHSIPLFYRIYKPASAYTNRHQMPWFFDMVFLSFFEANDYRLHQMLQFCSYNTPISLWCKLASAICYDFVDTVLPSFFDVELATALFRFVELELRLVALVACRSLELAVVELCISILLLRALPSMMYWRLCSSPDDNSCNEEKWFV